MCSVGQSSSLKGGADNKGVTTPLSPEPSSLNQLQMSPSAFLLPVVSDTISDRPAKKKTQQERLQGEP